MLALWVKAGDYTRDRERVCWYHDVILASVVAIRSQNALELGIQRRLEYFIIIILYYLGVYYYSPLNMICARFVSGFTWQDIPLPNGTKGRYSVPSYSENLWNILSCPDLPYNPFFADPVWRKGQHQLPRLALLPLRCCCRYYSPGRGCRRPSY